MGEFKDVSLEEPDGFVRKARSGSWRKDLSLKDKFQVWIAARKLMNEKGYPWELPW
jgi:hypothetical protein